MSSCTIGEISTRTPAEDVGTDRGPKTIGHWPQAASHPTSQVCPTLPSLPNINLVSSHITPRPVYSEFLLFRGRDIEECLPPRLLSQQRNYFRREKSPKTLPSLATRKGFSLLCFLSLFPDNSRLLCDGKLLNAKSRAGFLARDGGT